MSIVIVYYLYYLLIFLFFQDRYLSLQFHLPLIHRAATAFRFLGKTCNRSSRTATDERIEQESFQPLHCCNADETLPEAVSKHPDQFSISVCCEEDSPHLPASDTCRDSLKDAAAESNTDGKSAKVHSDDPADESSLPCSSGYFRIFADGDVPFWFCFH